MRIRADTVEAYAATLPAESPPAPDLDAGEPDERRAAFQITLNAINFGSGWFPTLRKQPGMSGFRTVEAGLRARGPWTADELAAIGRDEVAAALGQDPEHELMGLFETALRELGAKVRDGHGGSFLALARSQGSVEGLAAELASWPTWHDVSPYGGRAGAVLQARPDRRRRPRAGRPRARRRPAPPDAVRRQPRAARAADRRRARARRRARRPDRRRGADRARLARGGRDPRLRAARGRAARRRAPRADHRHGGRQRSSGTAAAARATRPIRATGRGRPPTEARARRAASSTAPSRARSGTRRRSASGTGCPCT